MQSIHFVKWKIGIDNCRGFFPPRKDARQLLMIIFSRIHFFSFFFFSLFSISLQSTRNKALFTFLARPCVHVWSWYFKKRANNRTNKMKATFEHALTNSSVNTIHARVIFLLLLLFNLSDDNAIRIRIFLRRMINKVFLFLR